MAGRFDEKKSRQYSKNVGRNICRQKEEAKLRRSNLKEKPRYYCNTKTLIKLIVLGVRSFDTYNKNNPALKVLGNYP